MDECIVYVLIDRMYANTLDSLISLRLGFEHSLKIRSITCDGTRTNFSAMKSFGCQIGKSLVEEINGEF